MMIQDLNGAQLMEKANPWLFSNDAYEEYPREYDELKHYLAKDLNASYIQRNSRPYTHVDFLDFLLYKKNDNATVIDLDRKLLCEYALYKVQTLQKSGKLKDISAITIEKLLSSNSESIEWYQCLLVLLESINATKIDESLFDIAKMNTNKKTTNRELQRRNTTKQTNISLQELTSFVLSSAVKKGIELKPANMDNPVEFLKDSIETLTNYSSDQDTAPREAQSDVTTIKREKEELETALKDLQLAHNFLTKQFEKDRTEYLQNMEQVQDTNKELQQKVLDYHAELSQSDSKVQELKQELNKLKEINRRNTDFLKNMNMTSPVPSPITFRNPESPTMSNGSGHSFSIMRSEFKRMFADSQKKYEKELQEERESRQLFEKELEELRKKLGVK